MSQLQPYYSNFFPATSYSSKIVIISSYSVYKIEFELNIVEMLLALSRHDVQFEL